MGLEFIFDWFFLVVLLVGRLGRLVVDSCFIVCLVLFGLRCFCVLCLYCFMKRLGLLVSWDVWFLMCMW